VRNGSKTLFSLLQVISPAAACRRKPPPDPLLASRNSEQLNLFLFLLFLVDGSVKLFYTVGAYPNLSNLIYLL